jgi:transglutaminase-like putative cysteine protease
MSDVKLERGFWLAIFLLFVALGAAMPPEVSRPAPASAKTRAFQFTYDVMVKDVPAGTDRLRVWIPEASSDANQTVSLKQKQSPVTLRFNREPEYGDRILYAEIDHPKQSEYRFTLTYEVTRREYSKGDYQSLLHHARPQDAQSFPPAVVRYLQPDRLVPIEGKMKTLAEQNTEGKSGSLEKAYALYDFAFRTLRYDKSGTGWGHGDSLWVCDSKRGNCTDFHSLFISMARAERIPARFEIGFPLPAGAHDGPVPGYHCWAEFYLKDLGWVPVDISEAWKDPSKHDYYFGNLDSNRVQFTVGRDITLVPKQEGPPLNYFVYPYAEADGKPYDKVEKQFAFHDKNPT